MVITQPVSLGTQGRKVIFDLHMRLASLVSQWSFVVCIRIHFESKYSTLHTQSLSGFKTSESPHIICILMGKNKSENKSLHLNLHDITCVVKRTKMEGAWKSQRDAVKLKGRLFVYRTGASLITTRCLTLLETHFLNETLGNFRPYTFAMNRCHYSLSRLSILVKQ